MNYYCQFLDFNLVDVTSFLINAVLVYLAIIGIYNYKKVSKWNSSYKYLTQVTESLSVMLLIMIEKKISKRIKAEGVDFKGVELRQAASEVNNFIDLQMSRISECMEKFYTSYQVLQYTGFETDILRSEYLKVRNAYLQMRKSLEESHSDFRYSRNITIDRINFLAEDCSEFEISIVKMLKKLNKL